MYGIDLSNHQKGIKFGSFDFDFAIVKATEGITFKDPSFDDHIRLLLGCDKLIGCYHYLRPDNQTTLDGVREEALNFLDAVDEAGLLGSAILCADWEQKPTDRVDILKAFLEIVENETGVVPFVYASKSWFNNIKWNSLSIKNPLWVANWPWDTYMKYFPYTPVLDDSFPDIENTVIWQFTSNGIIDGKRVDFNYTKITEDDWRKFASQNKIEKLSDDMMWAIENKLFHGYNDCTFRENEPLTRGQCATVLRRFYNMIRETEFNKRS